MLFLFVFLGGFYMKCLVVLLCGFFGSIGFSECLGTTNGASELSELSSNNVNKTVMQEHDKNLTEDENLEMLLENRRQASRNQATNEEKSSKHISIGIHDLIGPDELMHDN